MNELFDTIREPLYLIASSVVTWLLAHISLSQNGTKLIAEAIDYVLIKIFEVEPTKVSSSEKFDYVSVMANSKLTSRQKSLVEERYGSLDNFVQFVYDKYASSTLDAKKIKKCQ